MKLIDKGAFVIVEGNFLDWYDEETDTIFDTCPLKFENGRLLEINEEYVAIEKDEGFTIWEEDALGNVERVYELYWMTASEAEQRWGLSSGTVRAACVRGLFEEQIEKGLVRKSGKVWLVTDEAMKNKYGENKKKEVL
jgi:hypothetical protein